MKKINELRDYLLENYVDRDGDLDISGLDFSEFDGDIYVSGMKVEGNLLQYGYEVKGDYFSTDINVTGKITFEEPKKALKEITAEELEKIGYKIKEEEE